MSCRCQPRLLLDSYVNESTFRPPPSTTTDGDRGRNDSGEMVMKIPVNHPFAVTTTSAGD